MVSFVACLGSPRKERLSCIASLSRSQSPFCCCVPQESSRGSASDPCKSAAPTPPLNLTDHLLRSGLLPTASPLKNLHSASATHSTCPKKQRGRTVPRARGQLFLLRFTSFQQSQKGGTSCRARSAQFSAKRNRKNARKFAASSPLRSCPALLSLGNVVEESTTQLSPFLLTT
jgi:hypothetical protein